jgi:hypothetical protein
VAAAASASRRLPPAAIALALALLWLGLGSRTPDLAATVYRSSLFARDGFQVWDNAWYGGHHLLVLVTPVLERPTGPWLVAVARRTREWRAALNRDPRLRAIGAFGARTPRPNAVRAEVFVKV